MIDVADVDYSFAASEHNRLLKVLLDLHVDSAPGDDEIVVALFDALPPESQQIISQEQIALLVRKMSRRPIRRVQDLDASKNLERSLRGYVVLARGVQQPQTGDLPPTVQLTDIEQHLYLTFDAVFQSSVGLWEQHFVKLAEDDGATTTSSGLTIWIGDHFAIDLGVLAEADAAGAAAGAAAGTLSGGGVVGGLTAASIAGALASLMAELSGDAEIIIPIAPGT